MPVRGTGKGWYRKRSNGGTQRLYFRVTRRGRWYMWYVHRMVVAQALLRAGWLGWDRVDPDRPIPPGMHVNHQDHRPDHNCLENLVLLQDVIHNHVSRDHQMFVEAETGRRLAEENREFLEQYGIVM